MKRLEDDADALAAKAGERVLPKAAELDPVDFDLACVGPLEPGHDHQQGRFARARGADDADRFPAGDCQPDVPQYMHAGRASTETEIDAAHHRLREGSSCRDS